MRASGQAWEPSPRDERSAVRAMPAVVASSVMGSLYEELARIARGELPVLVLGETGVGKEVVARATHEASGRSGPFVAIHCAALPEGLLESELFGHERGAFTGATHAQAGLLEAAAGGTVLLDELGEIPLAVQVKLLRAIETRRVLRVGGRVERPLDVRFVSATSADLEAAMARRTFRADLYYRLAGYEVRVPPLRERREEIVPLAERFLAEACRDLPAVPRPGHQAREALVRYDWPGNVRELRNAMERAALLCTDGEIDLRALPFTIAAPRAPASTPIAPAPLVAGEAGLEDGTALERARIEAALARCAGNQTKAATLLGISRRTLVSRLSRYALPRPRKHAG